MFGLCVYSYSELTYDFKTHVYDYPRWAIIIGWLMASASVVMIPIVMIVKLLQAEGSLHKVSHSAV